MKFGKIRDIKHYVFDNEREFEDYFLAKQGVVPPINYDWRNAKRYEWVKADDGGIVQILQQKSLPHPNDRKNYKAHSGYVRTIVGSFFQNSNTEMDTDFSLHKSRYTFNGMSYSETVKRFRSRPNLSKRERLFVFELMSGKSLQYAHELAYGASPKWRERVLVLLKTKRIKDMIEKTIKEQMDEKGIGFDFILNGLKDLFEKSKNDNVKLGALRELGEYYGAKEQDRRVNTNTFTMLNPFDAKELDMIEAQEVKTIAAAEVE